MRLDHEARQLLGTPFLHQGRNPDIGIDCIGLPVVAGTSGCYAFVAYDSTDYDRNPANGVLESYLDRALGPWLPPVVRQPGDLVAIDYMGAIRHLCIVGEIAGQLTLIHTSSFVGRVVEHRIDAKWARRIKRTYRPEHPDVG